MCIDPVIFDYYCDCQHNGDKITTKGGNVRDKNIDVQQRE